MKRSEHTVSWKPSRVDGVADVRLATVHPDRLELEHDSHRMTVPFHDIAQWPKPRWFWRLASRLGCKPKWLPIGERDWFHTPRDRYFRFYTDPPLVVYGCDEPEELNYGDTMFSRAQRVWQAGGFDTHDSG